MSTEATKATGGVVSHDRRKAAAQRSQGAAGDAFDSALICTRLEAEGYSVMPLRACSKIPRAKEWQKRETTFTWRKSDNVGIRTEYYRGGSLVVVDLDNKPGVDGLASWHALLKKVGKDAPDTFAVATPSGGHHLYYTCDEPVATSASKLGPGIDIRSKGGQVVAPGGETEKGAYAVENPAPIAAAPVWLIEACGKPTERDAKAAEPIPGSGTEQDEQNAIAYLQDEAPEAIEGAGGDSTTYAVAARVRDFGVTKERCVELMMEHWFDGCGWTPEDLEKKVANAYAYGKNQPGVESAAGRQKAARETFEAVPVEEQDAPGADAANDEADTRDGQAKPRTKYRVRDAGALLDDPVPDWLVDDLVPDQGIGILYGQPAAGKTFVALHLAGAIARGVPFAGRDVKQGAVAYVPLEGNLQGRIEAYVRHHSLNRADIRNLKIVDGRAVNLLCARSEDAIALTQDIRAAAGPVAAVFIDTLSRAMPGGNENASETMTAAIGAAQAIATALKCVVMLVHHSGKDSSRGTRGHSSLHGAADVEIEVVKGADDSHTMRAVKVKDGEDGMRWDFDLHRVALQNAPNGKPRTSCVVANVQRAKRAGGDTAKLSTPQNVVLMALQEATRIKQDDPTTGGGVFDEVAVSFEDWRQEYYRMQEMPSQPSRKDADYFRKTVARLLEKGFVNQRGGNTYALPA